MEIRMKLMIWQVCGDIGPEERSTMIGDWHLHFDLLWIDGVHEFDVLANSSHNFIVNCINIYKYNNQG